MADIPEELFPFPPLSFHFEVSVGKKGEEMKEKEMLFTEATGFGMELDVDTSIVEGGNNDKVYVLPKRVKYTDLVLKRGVVPKDSDFYKWCESTINANHSAPIETKTVKVALQNDSKDTLITWNFKDAFPKKIEVSALNAKASGESAILVETITLAFSHFNRE